MWRNLNNAIRKGFGLYKVALIVYFLQLILALTIGIQVYQVLEASIGTSLELNKLLAGYDRTIISDFLHTHGASISPLVGQIRWLVLAYLIFSVFINSGLLYAVWLNKNCWKTFWEGAANYFFSFIKVALFFMPIFIALALFLIVPVVTSFNYFIENFSSEKTFLLALCICLVVFGLLSIFVFNWSVVSRAVIFSEKVKIWTAIRIGLRWMLSNWYASCCLMLALVVIQLLVVMLYFIVGEQSGMVSPFLIILFFFIQQLIVFFRILWKLIAYSAISGLYLSDR